MERERRDSGEKRSRPKFFKKKNCKFCGEKDVVFDYKDLERITKFLTEKGKIIPRRISGNCAKHQRKLADVIKKARHGAMIPFQAE